MSTLASGDRWTYFTDRFHYSGKRSDLFFLFITRSPHHASRFGPRVLALVQYLYPVYKHVHHAGGVLLRFFERGVVLDFRGVENRQVGKIAGLQQPALSNLQVGGGQVG